MKISILYFLKIIFIVLLFVNNSEAVYSQVEEINTIGLVPPIDYVWVKSATADPWDLVTLEVPAYLYSYGCTNTAAAMIIGYYDQNKYVNLYKGSKNGGTAPFDNSFWESATINGNILNYKNSISASIKGYDNRTIDGNVDDFWVSPYSHGDIGINDPSHPEYNNHPDPDPVVAGILPHPYTPNPCVADYMGTNQDYWNNFDAGTSMITWDDNSKCIDFRDAELKSGYARKKDGNHGLRKYIEDCGYSVAENYNQNIYGKNGKNAGFTFNDFKAEIDAKRPVIVNFAGHSCTGIGYSSSTQQICIFTTWAEKHLLLNWGANFKEGGNNLPLMNFSVIKLDPPPFPTGINDVVKIQNPPSGTIGQNGTIPSNTNLMTPCTNASFWANFTTDGDPFTYANKFDWQIVLYHSTGSYIYAQKNGILPNTSTPNWFGQGCVWQPTLGALPAYNWSIDYNGNIYGKVKVLVYTSDGGSRSDEFEIGVNPYQNIQNITYNTNTTINACAKLVLTNITITSAPTVTFNTGGKGITINGPFQAQKGSTLTINK